MKTALVTGANSGMGLVTAIELAKQGYHVIMACRNAERGQVALNEAMQRSKSNHLELRILDLSSMESIRSFAKQFQETYSSLDVLVNNAGILSIKRTTTSDGFEGMIGVNHLGHFLLTNLLLEPLKRAPGGRIVTVSSGAHKLGTIDFQDPHSLKRYSIMKVYGTSKLANILFTLELSERLKDSNVTANCLDPGAVATNIGISRKRKMLGNILRAAMKPFIPRPLKGAETAIYLATSPDVETITGAYFRKKRIVSPSLQAQDKQLAAKLWEWSEQQVGTLEG